MKGQRRNNQTVIKMEIHQGVKWQITKSDTVIDIKQEKNAARITQFSPVFSVSNFKMRARIDFN
jgi:hypothetical protein